MASSAAWPESSEAADDDSSADEAFCWVTLSISEMAAWTWSTPVVCWVPTAAISRTRSEALATEAAISPRVSATRREVTSPSLVCWTDSRMSASVLLDASLARSARERTSSATTAKPRPASPARAASTAALRASRLVWKAISLMSLMICEVPSEEARILAMAPFICSTSATPLAAAPRASSVSRVAATALSEAWRAWAATESMEPVVCTMAAACCEAPVATACDEAAI